MELADPQRLVQQLRGVGQVAQVELLHRSEPAHRALGVDPNRAGGGLVDQDVVHPVAVEVAHHRVLIGGDEVGLREVSGEVLVGALGHQAAEHVVVGDRADRLFVGRVRNEPAGDQAVDARGQVCIGQPVGLPVGLGGHQLVALDGQELVDAIAGDVGEVEVVGQARLGVGVDLRLGRHCGHQDCQ